MSSIPEPERQAAVIRSAEEAQRADALFAAALDLAEDERPGFLGEACAGKPELRRLVETLLDADRRAETFLETSWRRRAVAESEESLPAAASLSWAGPYRLLRPLGRGGMGLVYLAARADEQYEKLVAVKVLRGSGGGAEALRRFERERQILAALEHPNIAQLYDAGLFESGQPYLVLELVVGEPIDRFCDRHRLSVQQRLELFRTVCAAVAHAHRRLLIHRDLKPANILVTEDGTPKLLDFGIARAIDAELATEGGITVEGSGPLTPSHASPEQIQGAVLTTGSDVYSLGVLLYQMLAGRLPYSGDGSSALALARAICEETPVPLSGAVAGQAEAAEARSASPRELAAQLAGDLDAIAAKALRKDPAERYASVEQLSEDLRRHLAEEPVLARRGTWRYKAGKLLRRHRIPAALAALLTLTVLAFTAALGFQVARTEAQRAKAERVAQFFTELLTLSDPETAQDSSVTVQEVLDRGIERYRSNLDDQPEIQARILHTAGTVYQRLGLGEPAQELLEEALALRRRILGPDHPEVASTLRQLAEVLLGGRRDTERAERLLTEALAIDVSASGPDSLPVASDKSALAMLALYRGEAGEAVRLRREALAAARRAVGETDLDTRELEVALAIALRHQGELAEAEGLLREALDGAEGHEGFVLNANRVLATTLFTRDRLHEAREIHEQGLALAREVYPPSHPDLAGRLNEYGLVLSRLGEHQVAEVAFSEAVAIHRANGGDSHLQTAAALANLASNHRAQGDYEKAEAAYLESLFITDRVLPPGSPGRSHTRIGLGRTRLLSGNAAGAEEPLREALALRSQDGVDPYLRASAEVELGRCLVELDRFTEAEALLSGAEATLAGLGQARAERTRRQALEALVDLYERRRLPEKVEEIRRRLAADALDQ